MADTGSGEYILREAAGMTSRSREGIERGFPNSLYGVVAVEAATDEVVGMARIVGDGGTVFHVCDRVVHPVHQCRGLGTRMMEALMGYEGFGFEETRPASKGRYLRTE